MPRHRNRLTGREAALLRAPKVVVVEDATRGAPQNPASVAGAGAKDAADLTDPAAIRSVVGALMHLRERHEGPPEDLIKEVDRTFPTFVKRFPKLTCMVVMPGLPADTWKARQADVWKHLDMLLTTASSWKEGTTTWDKAEADVAEHLARQYIRKAPEAAV